MDPKQIRKLFKEADAATAEEAAQTAEEAAQTAEEARTNPETARALWQTILSMSVVDPACKFLFQALLESVLVDHISDRMGRDDEYALVISRRITELMEKMAPPPRGGSQRVRSA